MFKSRIELWYQFAILFANDIGINTKLYHFSCKGLIIKDGLLGADMLADGNQSLSHKLYSINILQKLDI